MPLGENVGEAYVRIYADGSSIPDDIRDELESAEPHVRAAGTKHGAAYDKAMAERLKSGQIAKSLREALGNGIADGMKVDEFFNSGDWTKIQTYIEKRWGENGRLAAASMEEEFRRQGSLAGIENALERFNNRVEKMLVDTSEEIARRAKQSAIDRLKAEKDLERETARIFADTDRLMRQSAAVQVQAADSVRKSWDNVYDANVRWTGEARRLRTEMEKITHLAGEARSPLAEFADVIDRGSDHMSRAFGRGSRNNFLNFFGGLTTIVPRAASGILRFASGIGELSGELQTATSGLSGMAKFGAILRVIGPLAGSAGVGLLAMGASLAVISGLLSSVAGAAVALVGTLGLGLVGAIGAVAGSLVPLIAGIGVAVVAFKSLSDAQKDLLAEDLEPVVSSFKDLGAIAADNIIEDLGRELASIAPVIESLGPAIDQMSSAVRGQIGAWTSLVASGGFTDFINLLRTDLPQQINLVGGVTRNLALVFTGLFGGMSDTVTRFLGDLNNLTSRFQQWLNSAEGQNSVRQFFEEAYDAAVALGNASLDAITFVSDLFRAGAQYGGNELFGDIGDKFAEWSDFLTNPANQDAIQGWVEDGADFARALGDVGMAIGEFIADLDTPLVRGGITASLMTIAESIRIIGDVARLSTEFTTGFLNSLGITDAISAGWSNLASTVSWAGGLIGAGGDDVVKSTSTQTEWFNHLTGAVGGMGHAVTNTATKLVGFVHTQQEQVRASIEARAAARKTAASWLEFGDSLDDATVSLKDWIRELQSQAQALINFTANARTAAKRGLDEGLIKSLKEAGPAGALRMRQLANASEQEIGRANAAWRKGQEAIRAYARMEVPPKEIRVDNDQAMGAIDALNYALSQIKSKDVTITTNLVYKRTAIDVATGSGPGGDAAGAYYGGVGSSPRLRWVMEDGPEAIVPLNRPLGQVDPSVRALSAIAQGLAVPSGGTSVGKQIDIGGITVISNSEDPETVARQVIAQTFAAAY